MPRLKVLLLLCISGSCLYAFMSPGHQQGKKQVMSIENQRPLERLIQITDSIKWAIQNDASNALRYEPELARLDSLLGEGPELANATHYMGRILSLVGQRERARYYFLRAHDLFIQANLERNAALSTIYIGMSYSDEGAYEKALSTFENTLEFYRELGDVTFQGHAYSHMAYARGGMGDMTGALQYNLKALAAFEQTGDSADAAIQMTNIASSYAAMGAYNIVLPYYERSLRLLKEAKFTINLIEALVGMGETLMDLGELERALFYFDSAYSCSKSYSSIDHIALSAEGIGQVLQARGDLEGALERYQESILLYESVNERVFIMDVYCRAVDCLILMGQLDKADMYLQKAARLTIDMQTRVPYMTYLNSAESLDSARGDLDLAYWKFKEHIHIRDSLFNVKNAHRLASQQFQYEAEKKEIIEQAERAKKEQRQTLIRNAILLALLGSMIFGVVIYRQRNRIKAARERSEELLLNILPEEVAEELKEKGHADPQLIDQVTVVFTDFKGFTEMSEKLSPEDLVNDLNLCFSAFDKITAKYGIEKIKTIGDAYMAAGGLPTPNTTHARDVIQAAFEMRDVVEAGKVKKIAENLPYFEIRIGIHTGPVVAGIVGVKKFQYDIWGDTVNTASRMESSGEVGKVNISETTYELIKDDRAFSCESRGKIKAKGKGEMEMFFVSPS